MNQKDINQLIKENEILKIKGYTSVIDLNTPVWKLSIGDLLDLLKQVPQNSKPEPQTTVKDFTGSNLIHGLAGLAKLLGCSTRTASKIKQSGKIDGAIIQDGRIITIDSVKALELLQKSKS
jgi:hypothetical protein